MAMVLDGGAAPEQVGAFLLLLRFRGENPEEMTGLVEAARNHIGAGVADGCRVDLDWPSYGAGRTRGLPWYLLAALALARAGFRVLMHGDNDFSAGTPVAVALAALGMQPATDRAEAIAMLARDGFAYLPLGAMSARLRDLLALRGLLGLRSPVNTMVRLLDPFDADAGIDGVFHPGAIALHLACAERLGRRRLLVVKGGGGEAERRPERTVQAHVHRRERKSEVLQFPAHAAPSAAPGAEVAALAGTWLGTSTDVSGEITAIVTIALALSATGPTASPAAADALAIRIWRQRLAART
jgi:anthranilate phosphoribosyltransferase